MSKHILLLAFAFPPVKVQMAPVSLRLAAELNHCGFIVDILTTRPPDWLQRDDSDFAKYISQNASRVLYVDPPLSYVSLRSKILSSLSSYPDRFAESNSFCNEALSLIAENNYQAYITVSPFHSINLIAIKLKSLLPSVPWIAFFGDPWANNPLEKRIDRRILNLYYERKALYLADLSLFSSKYALYDILNRYPLLDASKLSHLSHSYDPSLYPKESYIKQKKYVITFLGTLFGRRNPVVFYRALELLVNMYPQLLSTFVVNFYGSSQASTEYPPPDAIKDHVNFYNSISYLESLKVMKQSDLLLLIEADVSNSPFVPSKLFDYLGSTRPILGLVPEGEAKTILISQGHNCFNHSQVKQTTAFLENCITKWTLSYVNNYQCSDGQQAEQYNLRSRSDLLNALSPIVTL